MSMEKAFHYGSSEEDLPRQPSTHIEKKKGTYSIEEITAGERVSYKNDRDELISGVVEKIENDLVYIKEDGQDGKPFQYSIGVTVDQIRDKFTPR